ncbi:uncharacterized protein H6S33_004822 [Morchella sextelata]|uniref:uncharacterized protein n=1 Tax=Morchella sextelata TaxID=1174677 RepID=UPI001D051369|nr:uncharacterized protein H6S33_004822 [Morchella sextelata]KAH0605600.1 hypothetical protein H6S33_004822 [Morchella sextelata]
MMGWVVPIGRFMTPSSHGDCVNDLGYVSIWLRTQVIVYQTKPTLHVLVNGETWAGAFAVLEKFATWLASVLSFPKAGIEKLCSFS